MSAKDRSIGQAQHSTHLFSNVLTVRLRVLFDAYARGSFRGLAVRGVSKCDPPEIRQSSRKLERLRETFQVSEADCLLQQDKMQAESPPNQTIYINNLNEKIKEEELKKSLYAVFSQFGEIMDIVACKSLKLRGQAWVVFDDVTAATNALRQIQGFPFYDKPMRIQYAKSKSDVVAKADGTYVSQKRKKQDEKERKRREQQPEAPNAVPPQAGYGPAYAEPLQAATAPQFLTRPVAQEGPAPPNSILFAQNLPHEANNLMIEMLFQQFPGFKEVRMIANKPGIAFIEFGDENQASVALQALHNFKVSPTNPMQISYAKK